MSNHQKGLSFKVSIFFDISFYYSKGVKILRNKRRLAEDER